MIDKMISHYRIIEELGAGGMGVVYKAEDTKLKRVVALKFLPRDTVADPEAKARLLHEAQAAAALDHQNICTVYEIGEAGGHTFISMAFVEGVSVKDKIGAGPLGLDNVVDIAKQTAQGLAEAHGKGIIHRDIKPANLMVSGAGQVKIMDFGLARAEGHTRLTKSGASVGTVTYMSPEQARGEPVDHRADIWSFGVLLYEMTTGLLPFRGDHEHAVLYSVLNEDPEPPTALRTGVPMELERVISKAMAKKPEDRYQHVEDMLVDLNSIEKRIAASDKTGAAARSTGRPVSAGGGANKRLRIGAGLFAVVAVVVAFVFVLSQRGGDSGEQVVVSGDDGKIRSLAVLPFDNMMDDPEEDYFVEGMHEALLTSLSKLGSLRVISRTSVMRYKDTDKPMPEIARELDVDALIEGSVLRVGDEVRITAQLIDGTSDEHLWADSYDRDMRNVLSLLNEVAGAIAEQINATLTPEQAERLARARPVNLDAYEALLRGQQLFNTFKLKNVRESIEYFDKAIEIDPEFVEAHAWRGGAYMVSAIFGSPPNEVMPQAKLSAQRAIELDDGASVGHTAMGYVLLYYDRDWAAGGAAFRRALDIDPNSAMARHGYADYLVAMGKLNESVEQCLLGRKSNPLSPLSNAVLVGHLYIARRYDEAVAEADKLLAVDPNFLAVRGFKRRAYWQMGRREEAHRMYCETPWARRPHVKEALDRGYAKAGPEGAILAVAELLEAQSDTMFVDPLDIAIYYARGGEVESAMDWLERAEEGRSPTIIHTLLDPCFDSIRESPRFKALRRRMNFPD